MSTLTHSVDSFFNGDAAVHVFVSHKSIYSAGSITDWTSFFWVKTEKSSLLFVRFEFSSFLAGFLLFLYLVAIAELLPNEVPTIEKRKVKKDQEKKPSIVVIQGPKPGTPTGLSRMRQLLQKLKHNTPNSTPAAPALSKDAKTSVVAAPSLAAVDATPTDVVAAA
ncbi:hypothetical protein Ddye_029958 [Dipteronia dyeriana]|uniref:Uncharacterized protein n=1 Tax=Dipteronia dyeriana TaxID=168575 RepID=A0AAD9TG46_9ROSI|nr:hypothetical protein Ddye_029958 [Dipteronia dyeriana]